MCIKTNILQNHVICILTFVNLVILFKVNYTKIVNNHPKQVIVRSSLDSKKRHNEKINYVGPSTGFVNESTEQLPIWNVGECNYRGILIVFIHPGKPVCIFAGILNWSHAC